MVIGNIITGFLLDRFDISTATLLKTLPALCLVGVVMMFFVRPVDSLSYSDGQSLTSPIQNFISTFSAMKDKKTLLLIIGMIYQGMSSALTFGSFPKLMPIQQVPFVFLIYGIGLCIGSFSWGKIYDRFSWKNQWKVMIFSSFFLIISGYIFTDLGIFYNWNWMFFIYGISFGLTDSCMSNFLYATMMGVFLENSVPIFAIYRFVTSFTASINYIFASYIENFIFLQIVVMVLFIIGSICIAYLYHIVEKEKRKGVIFSKLEEEDVDLDLSNEATL